MKNDVRERRGEMGDEMFKLLVQGDNLPRLYLIVLVQSYVLFLIVHVVRNIHT